MDMDVETTAENGLRYIVYETDYQQLQRRQVEERTILLHCVLYRFVYGQARK